MTRTVLRRLTAAAAALIVSTSLLAGCATASSEPSPSGGDGGYPMTLTSPYGETTLAEKPTRVAVVSSVDLDIALALGVVPVISPQFGDAEPDPWATEELQKLGEKKLKTYDSTDGVDYEAVAAAEPDVILATSGWTLDADYEQLSKIAPIVSYTGKDGLSAMTWEERTEAAAVALGRSDRAKDVIDSIAADFDAAAAANPELDGTTFTYAVVHPEQITYISYEGGDITFFTKLGLTLPESASDFDATSAAVSRENLDLLDADILLMGYPFGDEGILTRSDLEKDTLFQQIPAVADGRYAVIDDAFASPLTYPTPLSEPWLLERLVPVLVRAADGNGAQ